MIGHIRDLQITNIVRNIFEEVYYVMAIMCYRK